MKKDTPILTPAEIQTFPYLLKTLIEVSYQQNYRVDILDRNLIKVSFKAKSFWAGANSDVGINPINPHFAAELTIDKARTQNILTAAGLRVPNGDYFFVSGAYRKKGKGLNEALTYARKLGFPVFIKPNRGKAAKLSTAIYSAQKLKESLAKIAQIDSIVLIQELLHLPEYRIVAVDGEIQYCFRKIRPQITGDGLKTIAELVRDFNAKLPKSVADLNSHFMTNQLKQRNLNPASILKPGASLPLSSVSNRWAGGSTAAYSERMSKASQTWLKKVSQILNLRVMALDLFAEGPIDNPENFIIIEANHNPGHLVIPPQKAREIIALVCQKYFNE